MKKMIWTNKNFNELNSQAKEIMAESQMSWEDAYSEALDNNNEALCDERANLDIKTGTIIAIADLGLWDGRRPGYRIVGENISNCLSFSGGDYAEWWVDEYGDLKGSESHHDGTNYYTYREIRSGVSEGTLETFFFRIVDGTVTPSEIIKYTKALGSRVCAVYGW